MWISVTSEAAADFSAADMDRKVLWKWIAHSVHFLPCKHGLCSLWNSSMWEAGGSAQDSGSANTGVVLHRSSSYFLGFKCRFNANSQYWLDTWREAAFFMQAIQLLLLIGKLMNGSQFCSMQKHRKHIASPYIALNFFSSHMSANSC